MSLPVDHAVRVAAATDLATSFFLEAGAGTGKTRILVDRVVEIVARGAGQISEIVVITFTEKAAAELRSRVRDRLHERATTGEFDERYRCRLALRRLANAHIETIHAFASSLIRDHPLETGIDPNFRQLDDIHGEIDFQERWYEWIWNVSGSEAAAVERCLELGMSLATIQEVARAAERLRELSFSHLEQSPPAAATVAARLGELVERAGDAARGCSVADDACLKAVAELDDRYRALAALPPPRLERGLRELRPRPRRGTKSNWLDAEQQRQAFVAVEEVSQLLHRYRQEVNTAALGRLAPVVAELVRHSARHRKRDGRLNFEDLLLEARDLVVGSRRVRRQLQRRFRYLLVDEFQDTDPLQAELVFLLAAEEEVAGEAGREEDPAGSDTDGARRAADEPSALDWRSVTMVPGKLFLVGDPKQSIYRFRRADIDIYTAAKRVFERQPAGARVASIVQTFRAVPQIAEWVNDIFAQVLVAPGRFPDAQPEYVPIQAHRPGLGGSRVLLLYPRVGLETAKMSELRGEEAQAIAATVRAVVGSEDWKIGDERVPGAAPQTIRHADVCVLVDTRTAMTIYTDVLAAAGVPYVLDGGKEFFQRQEIRDLAAILRVIDDPSDQVSLVAALKAEAFACSDVELLRFRLDGGRLSLFDGTVEGDSRADADPSPVRRALHRLLQLHRLKAELPLPELVDRVMRDTMLTEPLLFSRDGARRAGNLRLIVERATEFAAAELDALRPFIRWLSQRQMEAAAESEAQPAGAELDAVRIMTVHSAKGLEFPVVILAKLSGGVSGDRERQVVDREHGVLELEVGPERNRFRTPGFARAEERERAYQEAEEARLLYVAATRARDLLVVPVYKSERFPGKLRHLPMLPSQLAATERGGDAAAGYAVGPASGDGSLPRIVVEDEIPRLSQRSGRPASQAAPLSVQFPEDLAERWRDVQTSRAAALEHGPVYATPSQMGQDGVKLPRETGPPDWDEDERDADLQDDDGQPLAPSAGVIGAGSSSSARQRGTLVHEVLARCDLSDLADARRWVAQVTAANGASYLSGEVGDHVLAILRSAGAERVRAAAQLHRELPLVYMFDDAGTGATAPATYVEGYVDLAFEEADGWVVADYKTDRIPTGGDVADLVERYRPQLAAYSAGLRAAGLTVRETVLWFSATGEMVSVDTVDNAPAIRDNQR